MFFRMQKTKVIFLDTKVFFWDTKCYFRNTKNLDIFGGQRGLINSFFVVDMLESQKRPGWGSTVGEPKSSRKSSRKKKAHITGKGTQTTGAGKQHKQQRKQQKQQQRHEPRRWCPKGLFVLSLASSRGISVVFLRFFLMHWCGAAHCVMTWTTETNDDSQPFLCARYNAKLPSLNPNILPRFRRHAHETNLQAHLKLEIDSTRSAKNRLRKAQH